MKKFILILLIMIIIVIATLVVLHFVGIFSLYDVVKAKILALPQVETYMLNDEIQKAYEDEIEELHKEIILLKEEREQLIKQTVLLNQKLEEKDREIERVKELKESEAKAQLEQEERLQQIAYIYNGMSPADAAQVLAKVDEELIIEMMPFWDERFASKLMASLDRDLSARLTEMMIR